MQISWKNLKAALGELVTSKQLSEDSAKLIADSATNDVTAETVTTLEPVAAAVPATPEPVAVAVPAPAPTPAPAVPVAAVPAADADELAKLRAENAALKAKVTPGLAAAVPTDDATQTATTPKVAQAENSHYARLKRVKEKYTRFGLTAEIDLGEPAE
jgi:hypothetical protein